MKQLQQILKHFTVRVGEDMKVLSKPETFDLPLGEGNVTHKEVKLCDAYNNALELVQMPRVMEYIDSLPLGSSIYEVLDFVKIAKQPPKLYQYIACDQNGKPMEKPTKPENLKFSVHIENMYNEACKAYETAKSKVMFVNWEVLQSGNTLIDGQPTDFVSITNGNHVLTFTDKGCYTSYCGGGLTKVSDLDKAFGEIPHFVKLDKLT